MPLVRPASFRVDARSPPFWCYSLARHHRLSTRHLSSITRSCKPSVSASHLPPHSPVRAAWMMPVVMFAPRIAGDITTSTPHAVEDVVAAKIRFLRRDVQPSRYCAYPITLPTSNFSFLDPAGKAFWSMRRLPQVPKKNSAEALFCVSPCGDPLSQRSVAAARRTRRADPSPRHHADGRDDRCRSMHKCPDAARPVRRARSAADTAPR